MSVNHKIFFTNKRLYIKTKRFTLTHGLSTLNYNVDLKDITALSAPYITSLIKYVSKTIS